MVNTKYHHHQEMFLLGKWFAMEEPQDKSLLPI